MYAEHDKGRLSAIITVVMVINIDYCYVNSCADNSPILRNELWPTLDKE